MKISELVARTVATGVPPLELTYTAVRDCRTNAPVAYRTEVAVNSIELGRLMQGEFSRISDRYEVGIRVSEWAIAKALEQATLWSGRETPPAWISVECPVALAEQPDFYDRMKKLSSEAKLPKGMQLCLEFPDSLLLSKADVRTSILDLKLLGMRSLVVCNNLDTCPFFRLVDIPADSILITPRMAMMVENRDKPAVLNALVQYLHSMGAEVIANGAQTSDHIRAFSRMECEGYLAAGEASLTPEEAAAQEEEKD